MRISSARSASNCGRAIHWRSLLQRRISALHHTRNPGQEKVEAALLLHKLPPPRRCNSVIPGAPVVFGHRPLGGYETVEQQTLQRGIERSLPNLERVV